MKSKKLRTETLAFGAFEAIEICEILHVDLFAFHVFAPGEKLKLRGKTTVITKKNGYI